MAVDLGLPFLVTTRARDGKGLPQRADFSCSTPTDSWFGDNWMIADQATESRLLAKIYARLLMRCWQVNPEQKPSVGCNIKWKPGNEPSYYG